MANLKLLQKLIDDLRREQLKKGETTNGKKRI